MPTLDSGDTLYEYNLWFPYNSKTLIFLKARYETVIGFSR